MRALVRTGESKTLHLDTNHPEPTAADSPSSYLIRPKAVALTRGELSWPEPLTQATPVPAYDVAGVVISLPVAPLHGNSTEHRFKVGDDIYALTDFAKQGNAREVSVASEDEMALKPRNVSWEEAASIPLSALSAWQALFVHGGLNPKFDAQVDKEQETSRPRVLVTAASGGVGNWGVQLAHLAGAHVVGTCGPSNVAFVKSLGADEVLDYSKTGIREWVNGDKERRGFDCILDCIGGATLADSWQCARTGGRVVSVAEPPDGKRPSEGIATGVEGKWFIVSGSRAQLSRITALIEEGKCKGAVDKVFGLENWGAAFDKVEKGHAKGKVVVRVS